MFTVSSDFIGDFKLGDNINHNLRILTYLYERINDTSDHNSWLLRKLAIVLIGSISEAILHDVHMRMRTYTREGVLGMAATAIAHVRSKKIDDFEKYIASAKKQSILGPSTDDIYNNLDELRKLRNRVHIQNEKNHFEANDSQTFNSARLTTAEQTLEKLVKTVSRNHPRNTYATGHVSVFNFPWNEHSP